MLKYIVIALINCHLCLAQTYLSTSEQLNIAKHFHESKDYAAAIRVLDKIIKQDKLHLEAIVYRGQNKFEINNIQGALDDFNLVIDEDPNFAAAYAQRGDLYYETDVYNMAIKDYSKYISLKPTEEFGYFSRGLAYLYLNKNNSNKDFIKLAINDFNSSITINTANANSHFYKGILKMILEDYEGAEEAFNLAINLAPADPKIYLNRGIVYYNTYKDNAACADLIKAHELGSVKAQKLIKQICKN